MGWTGKVPGPLRYFARTATSPFLACWGRREKKMVESREILKLRSVPIKEHALLLLLLLLLLTLLAALLALLHIPP